MIAPGHFIDDWDDAYANAPHVVGGDVWPEKWKADAEAFREPLTGEGRARLDLSYGDAERNRFDLFLPDCDARGLAVFIHGGYWLRLDKSYFSHFAQGCLARGFAVAMPSYTLCPAIRISGIVEEIGQAITGASSMIEGKVHLAGHSAGGHLAARMASTTSPLPPAVRSRLENIVSISGVHDLRPIMNTAMNDQLAIDSEEAARESPALLHPLPGVDVTCWVGQAERSEFLRQNALLANIWTGLGARTLWVEEPDRHHFNIVESLRDPQSGLVNAIVG